MPLKPNVRVVGVLRLRRITVVRTVPFAGISGEGKYCASGCGAPSIVKPVTIAGTPAASRRLRLACQLNPSASEFGQTVLGPDGTMAATLDGMVMRIWLVAPSLLNAASPEYAAERMKVPVPS